MLAHALDVFSHDVQHVLAHLVGVVRRERLVDHLSNRGRFGRAAVENGRPDVPVNELPV